MKRYILEAQDTDTKEFKVAKAVTTYFRTTIHAHSREEAEEIAYSLSDDEWTPPDPNDYDEEIRIYSQKSIN